MEYVRTVHAFTTEPAGITIVINFEHMPVNIGSILR
jgi:hypothetical protein